MRVPFVPAIAVIGLLQMCVMVTAILSVGTMMKASGFPHLAPMEAYSENTIFIRRWWFLLLCIPVAWAAWASWDLEENPDPIMLLRGHLVAGVIILFAMSFFTTLSAAQAVSPGHLRVAEETE